MKKLKAGTTIYVTTIPTRHFNRYGKNYFTSLFLAKQSARFSNLNPNHVLQEVVIDENGFPIPTGFYIYDNTEIYCNGKCSCEHCSQ